VKVICGLGNPGRRYRRTRHNLGFRVVELLAKEEKISMRNKAYHSLVADAVISGQEVLLVKPLTFVNSSGLALREIVDSEEIGLENILVICDDINLPLGKLRIRRKGAHGGHKGLKSITEHLGTSNFPRLRIGVGSPGETLPVDYVLSGFKRSESRVVAEAVKSAAQAARTWVSPGIDECMNRFN
jgi:PTH1 family peptidyl-tRNA hydrolase